MAVFPLENGVFSGTLLRFNVRGYVYIWSLIFSMFNFLCVAIYACSLRMLLIVGARCVCLFREMGKWDLGEMGDVLLNGLIGGNGSISGSVSNLVIK